MRTSLIMALLLLLSLPLAACDLLDQGLERIDGQIYWEDGQSLPAGSTITVRIVDASIENAPDELTMTTFEAEGPSPIAFYVEYDEGAASENVDYAALVRIEDPDGQLIYITQLTQMVIQDGDPVEPVRILVEPV